MSERFKWQHIEFADGSNPYVCKTKESFEFMQQKYKLKQIKYGFWLATDKQKDTMKW